MQHTTRTDWSDQRSLATGAVRGAAVTAAGTAARFAVQLGTTVVLARLLGPHAYGFAAVTVVIGGLVELLRASGLATVITRAPQLSGRSASTLHLISIAIGITAAGAVVLAAPAIASLTGFADHRQLVVLLGLAFIPAGVVAVPGAVLVRNLRFGVVSGAEVVAMVTAASVAVLLAVTGAGAVALAAQLLVFTTVIAVVVTLRCPWRASRPARPRELRADLGLAVSLSGVQVLTFLSRNVDRLIVGAAFGPSAAGLYAQASQLLVLPLDQLAAPLQRVAVPVLARVQADRERFVDYYRRLAGTAALVLWPVFTILAAAAGPLIELLFGPAWSGSVPIFRVLAIAGIAQTVGYVTVWVFVATGQGKQQALWALVSRPIVAAACFLGIPFGPIGMATTVSVVSVLFVVPGFLVAARRPGLRLADLIAPLAGPAAVAIVAGSAAACTAAVVVDLPPFVAVSLIGVSGVLAGLGVVSAIGALRRDCMHLLRIALRRPVPTRATA